VRLAPKASPGAQALKVQPEPQAVRVSKELSESLEPKESQGQRAARAARELPAPPPPSPWGRQRPERRVPRRR